MIWRWILSAILLLLTFWAGNLAMACWWAAGGPPNPNAEMYAFRGNIYFALACFFLVAFVILVVVNIRQLRKKPRRTSRKAKKGRKKRAVLK